MVAALFLLVSLVSSRRRIVIHRRGRPRGGLDGAMIPEIPPPPPPPRPAGGPPALPDDIPEDQKDKSTPVIGPRSALAKSARLELLSSLLSVAGTMAVVAIMFFVGYSLLRPRGPRNAKQAERPLLVAQ
jgi:hypothetical protein